MYHDVRGPDGRKLFRFDPERDLVEIRHSGTVYTVDLSQFRPAPAVAVIEIAPLSVDLQRPLDSDLLPVVISQ